jgi:peptidyl-prolyl cis-trans isomerase SurA
MRFTRGSLITLSFIALFLSFLKGLSDGAVMLDRVVAVVNKEVITWSELYKMMEYDASDKVKALDEQARMKVFKDNEAVFLDRLIDMRLEVQEAARIGLEVSTEEVKEAIEDIKKKYSLTDKALEESLKKDGLTFEEYKKRLSEQILVSQLVNREIRSKIVLSDGDAKKYFDANRDKFSDGETFKLREILLKKPEHDADRKAVEERASLIMERLKAGDDFSALAREYSDDPSGKMGGDLGYIKKSYMAKEFVEVLSHMKVGDFSSPFWTEKGLHIIKLDEKVPPKSAAEVMESVKKQLAEAEFTERYKSWIKGLREKAHIEIRL